RVLERMTGSAQMQFAASTTARTADEFVRYLKQSASERVAKPSIYLSDVASVEIEVLREAEAAIAAAEIEVAARVFVGGIAAGATEREIRDGLTEAGLAIREITLPRDRDTGRNRGYAFVEFEDGRTAMKALAAQGSLRIQGRQVRLAEAHVSYRQRPEGRRAPVRKLSEVLYVGNLAPSVDETTLRQAFRSHEMDPTSIIVKQRAGERGGYAFASMASVDEAARAIGALHNTIIEGHRVSVRPAAPRGGKR
ncbi:MAG: RNA-binding protein, partial [Candidatus Rokuibacteriota bacterium]